MQIPKWLKIPAERTVTEVALVLALLHLAGALWAILWLAGIIAWQREIIRLFIPSWGS